MNDPNFVDQLWIARHLDALRQEHEDEMEACLLDLIEIGDIVWAMLAGAALVELPPAWQEAQSTLWQKIQRKLHDRGVGKVPAQQGQMMDPAQHVVVEILSQPGPPGSIVKVNKVGYSWKNRVLRPAEVVVIAARAPHEGH